MENRRTERRINEEQKQALKRLQRLYDEQGPLTDGFAYVPYDQIESANLADYMYDLEEMGYLATRDLGRTFMIKVWWVSVRWYKQGLDETMAENEVVTIEQVVAALNVLRAAMRELSLQGDTFAYEAIGREADFCSM